MDSSLSVSDRALVRPGDRVEIEDQDLNIRTHGTVRAVSRTPGATPAGIAKIDPSRFYMAVVPSGGPNSLVGASVKLTISVKSTSGPVLTVPVSAVSVGGDGNARVQVERHGTHRAGHRRPRPRGRRARRGPGRRPRAAAPGRPRHRRLPHRAAARPGDGRGRPVSRPARTPPPGRGRLRRSTSSSTPATSPRGRRSPGASPRSSSSGWARVFGAEPPVVALRDVDLTLPRGTSLAIVGPSGSGKSTLLNILGLPRPPDQRAPTSSTASTSARSSDDERAAPAGRAHRLRLPVASTCSPTGPVLENVMLAEVYRGAAPRGPRRARARRPRPRRHDRPGARSCRTRLSGGEQQRVAIARALHGRPQPAAVRRADGQPRLAPTPTRCSRCSTTSRDAGLTLVIITHEDHVAAHAHRRVRIIDGCLTEEDA